MYTDIELNKSIQLDFSGVAFLVIISQILRETFGESLQFSAKSLGERHSASTWKTWEPYVVRKDRELDLLRTIILQSRIKLNCLGFHEEYLFHLHPQDYDD
ncbi:hypothetical protein L3Y34_004976 [Caenorhabditis briggsae]|uniref:Uncharacterized protein n=1 Tax=Caenorhabditis briggsae TaxID=6238 RepID=A0AAE9ADJ6_CAEBR|nr:hypothetical protein L3Y34_004976 [Caenorhabditis briggsae]